MSEISVAIRKPTQEDIARIIRQWNTSYRNSRWAGVIPNNLFRSVNTEQIRQVLSRGAQILVACNSAQPEIILGFLCYEHTPRDRILHYCFVRSYYREAGIARLLMDTAGFPKGSPFVYTWRTDDASLLCQGARHMPELARRKSAHKQEDAEVDPDRMAN